MNIYEALANVMKDCTAVGKDSKNPQQGYKYRGIDAVMNAVNPALTKNRVFVAPEVLEATREERTSTGKGTLLIYSIAKVRYTFYAEDGTSVTAVVIGEGMDSGDKSMNKAMSAAFKYALFQVLCIPTEEMIDSETDSPEPQAKKQNAPTRKPPAIESESYAVEESGEKLSPVQVKTLKEVCENHGMPEEKLAGMYGRKSLEDMTISDWLTFSKAGKRIVKEWDEQHRQEVPQEPIGSKAGIELSILLKRRGVNIEKLCEQKGVKSLAELTGAQYTSIIKQLEKKV